MSRTSKASRWFPTADPLMIHSLCTWYYLEVNFANILQNMSPGVAGAVKACITGDQTYNTSWECIRNRHVISFG